MLLRAIGYLDSVVSQPRVGGGYEFHYVPGGGSGDPAKRPVTKMPPLIKVCTLGNMSVLTTVTQLELYDVVTLAPNFRLPPHLQSLSIGVNSLVIASKIIESLTIRDTHGSAQARVPLHTLRVFLRCGAYVSPNIESMVRRFNDVLPQLVDLRSLTVEQFGYWDDHIRPTIVVPSQVVTLRGNRFYFRIPMSPECRLRELHFSDMLMEPREINLLHSHQDLNALRNVESFTAYWLYPQMALLPNIRKICTGLHTSRIFQLLPCLKELSFISLNLINARHLYNLASTLRPIVIWGDIDRPGGIAPVHRPGVIAPVYSMLTEVLRSIAPGMADSVQGCVARLTHNGVRDLDVNEAVKVVRMVQEPMRSLRSLCMRHAMSKTYVITCSSSGAAVPQHIQDEILMTRAEIVRVSAPSFKPVCDHITCLGEHCTVYE